MQRFFGVLYMTTANMNLLLASHTDITYSGVIDKYCVVRDI